MDCDRVRDQLPEFDEREYPATVMAHLEGCDDCRTLVQQYQELDREMKALADYEAVPPAWLEAVITEATLERLRRTAALRAASRQLGEHRGVAAGGALLLAGVAGAILYRGRNRKRVALTPPPAAA